MFGLVGGLFLFLFSSGAFLISAVSGGGAGLILIPALRLVLPVAQVPGALAVGTSVSSLSRIALLRQNIRWDVVRQFVPLAIPGTIAGACLLRFLNPDLIEFALSLFLLSNLPFIFAPQSGSEKDSGWTFSSLGLAAGFVSGLTGAVGVLFNGHYLRSGLRKEEIVATRAANEVILHLAKLVVYALLGLLTWRALEVGAVVALGALLATGLTKSFLNWISERTFQRLGYSMMVLSGLLMFSSSAHRLANNGQVGPVISEIFYHSELDGQSQKSNIEKAPPTRWPYELAYEEPRRHGR